MSKHRLTSSSLSLQPLESEESPLTAAEAEVEALARRCLQLSTAARQSSTVSSAFSEGEKYISLVLVIICRVGTVLGWELLLEKKFVSIMK